MKDCAKLYLKLKPNEETEIILDHSEAFIITLQIQKFIEISGGETLNYFSYAINIPWDLNKVALNFILDKNVKGNDILKCGRIPARIECECLDFQGNIKFLGYDLKCKNRTLTAQYVGGLDNWTNCIDGDLCDLNLGLYQPREANTYTNMFDSSPYNGSVNYWTSLKYFGGLQGNTIIPSKYHRPDIYDAAIIDAINKKDCPNICGDIFETEWFRRLLFVNAKQGFDYTATTFTNFNGQAVGAPNPSFIDIGANFNVSNTGAGIYPIQVFDPNTGLAMSAVVFDQGPSGIFGPFARDLEVTVKFSGNLIVGGGTSNLLVGILNNVSTGSTPSNASSFTGPAVTTGFNEFEYTFDAFNYDATGSQTGYGLGFTGNVLIQDPSNFSICLTNADLAVNVDPFELNQFLPCIPTIDYIKDISALANLIPFFDQKTNCVNFRPAWDAVLTPTGEKVEGFYRPKEQARDITNEVECGISNGTFKVSENNCLNFCFCEDGSDQYVNNPFKDSEETYLGFKYCQPIAGQANKEGKVSTLITAATRNGLLLDTIASAPVPSIPYILNSDPNDPSQDDSLTYDMKPRRLYKAGVVQGGWSHLSPLPYPVTGPTIITETSYPYATQVDTGLGINLGWDDQDGVPGMANTFYPKTIDLQLNSGTKKARWMPEKIQLIDQEEFFRTPVRIKDKVTGDCTFIVSALQRWMPCENLPGTGCFIEYPNT